MVVDQLLICRLIVGLRCIGYFGCRISLDCVISLIELKLHCRPIAHMRADLYYPWPCEDASDYYCITIDHDQPSTIYRHDVQPFREPLGLHCVPKEIGRWCKTCDISRHKSLIHFSNLLKGQSFPSFSGHYD